MCALFTCKGSPLIVWKVVKRMLSGLWMNASIWVPKLAVLSDSKYLHQGASRRAKHWRSRGWTISGGTIHAHVPVWEILLPEMEEPGRGITWEHVPAHVNVEGTAVANGLALEGRCSSPLWSWRPQQSATDSESTVGLARATESASEVESRLWESLGLVPMDSDELTGEASGPGVTKEGGESHGSGSTNDGVEGSMIRGDWEGLGERDGISLSETESFSTDVSESTRKVKKTKFLNLLVLCVVDGPTPYLC